MKYLVLILVMSLNCLSLDLDSRRNQIIEIIDEELDEVSRLSTQKRSPSILLRMAELNLEKARLWREKENEEYLKLSSAKRRRIKKSSYFKKSTKYFRDATNLCLKITKSYKNYKNIADVYYILGFNAKESNQTKKATKYFSLANKKSSKNSKANIRSKISLAELYYNQGKFKSAAYLYEKALSVHSDKWWTKDSFNLAWSYYRIGKQSKAISKMKEIHSKSKRSQFVDMRGQVERDIGIMFATSNKVDAGIAFYKKLDVDFAPMLVGIAVNLKKQGKLSDATKVLGQALKYSKSKELNEQVYIEQLDLFAKFNRYQSHLNTSKKIYKLKNDVATSTLDRLIFHSKKQGALLQKQVTSKTYKRLVKVRKSKANMAITYFSMVASLSKKDRAEYKYLEAETAKVVNRDLYALKKYEETYKLNSQKFKSRAMDGMLYSLNSRYIPAKTKESWYVKVYESFIKDFPKDKRVQIIYQKLFKVYLDKKNYVKAKNTLDRYAQKYPKDYKSQEAMIGSLIEIDRKKKDYNAIKLWVSSVDAKDYFVSSKYKTKLKELLTSVQIDGVQSQLEKGNKKAALSGYLNVLKDKYATKKAKLNANYNIAALYFELRDVEKSYKWSLLAIDEMTPKQTSQFASSFLTISKFYFTKMEFKKSILLSEKLLTKMCGTKNRIKNIAFKNAAFLSLANNDISYTENLIKKAKRCSVYNSYLTDVQFEVLKVYKEKEMWKNFESTINSLAQNKKNRGELISNLDDLESIHRKLGNLSDVKKINKRKLNYYYEAKKNRYNMSASDLDVIADMENKKLDPIINRVVKDKLSFPENRFNSQMQSKLRNLDQLTTKAIAIQKIGSGKGIVVSYQKLITTYSQLVDSIKAFVPPGKSKDYIKSFKGSMNSLVVPLAKTLNSYKINALDSIVKNEILTKESKDVLLGVMSEPIEFLNTKNGYLMDRGGL